MPATLSFFSKNGRPATVMGYLVTCDSPFSLQDLASKICASSNFRFDWQFYQFDEIDPRSPVSIRDALDSIITVPDLHRFLRDSFDAMYDSVFEIKPVHDHCRIAAASGELEDVLARAAGNHLGAYSRDLRSASLHEKGKIEELFGQIGGYIAYQLLPGSESGCSECRDYNHLFTNWFYRVAWDWCLFAVWPKRKVLWMGCLTDTD
jgi:hypothetical protein